VFPGHGPKLRGVVADVTDCAAVRALWDEAVAAYGATKRAVTYLTDALAEELGKDAPVTVAHLSPGTVVADLLSRDYTPEEFAKAKKVFNILADRVETAGVVALIWALLPTAPWWPFAALSAAVAGGAVVAGTMRPVFILATAGVTTVSVIGAVYAGRRRAWTAIALYTLGIVLVPALVPLRNHPSHETLRLQWIEQATNTAAQLALLAAAWLTVHAYRRSPAPEVLV
jgi:hypothetical protein